MAGGISQEKRLVVVAGTGTGAAAVVEDNVHRDAENMS